MTKEDIIKEVEKINDPRLLDGFGTEINPIDITSINISKYLIGLLENMYGEDSEIYIPYWLLIKLGMAGDYISETLVKNFYKYGEIRFLNIRLIPYKSTGFRGKNDYIYIKNESGEYYAIFRYCNEP